MGSLPEDSLTWRNGVSKSQWHLHVFVTMSNDDTSKRQESEQTGMCCDTDSKAEKLSMCERNGASLRDIENAGVCPFMHNQPELCLRR